MSRKTLIALDLDGTITAPRTKIEEKNLLFLKELSRSHRIVIIGAGYYERIIAQAGFFPCDVLGNYGMQHAEYSEREKKHILIKNDMQAVDRENVLKCADMVFEHFELSQPQGDGVVFFPSGCFSLALLGTHAKYEDKMLFDPTKEKRRKIHEYASGLFSDYSLYLGGSTSIDAVPRHYNKYKALCDYCEMHGIAKEDVIFCGDDYGKYGNDEPVYLSDFDFLKIDDYRTLPDALSCLI